MSDVEVDIGIGSHGNSDKTPIEIRYQEEDKVSKMAQLVHELTALHKKGNPENQEQEEQISTGPEPAENPTPKFKFELESETRADKEKQENTNKRLKTGVILTLCFLLLNFVLVLFVMHWTSEISCCCSRGNFSASACQNQTEETGEILDDMAFELDGIKEWVKSTSGKFESQHFQIQLLLNETKIEEELEAVENGNGELKKSHKELKEQFESLSEKMDVLKSNISSSRAVSPQTTTTPSTTTTTPTTTTTSKKPVTLAPPPKRVTSCSHAMEILSSSRSKKQTIYPHGNESNKSLEVLCDFESDGGGWTLIQKRSRGPKQEFNRTWNEYENGFGSLDGNFWIGLENIHALTKNGDQELRIDLEDHEGNKRYAKYSSFSVSDASDFYRLNISGFSESSTAGDSMALPNHGRDNLSGMRFSTRDKDNDNISGFDCAQVFGVGGWWFNNCAISGLNGLYFEKGETVPHGGGVRWSSWKGHEYSYAKSEMKIRKRK